jgi:hypothetical protein
VVVFIVALRVFRYSRSCVSLRLFVCLGAHLANWPCIASGCPSCQLDLPCPWSPTLARLLVCFVTTLRAFGPHVANSPCIAFGRPCCELALRCARAPDLDEAVLKNLPPSQNWFLSILRLVFLPSAPLCGRFPYGSSCVSLWPFVRFVTALRAFGHPSCHLALHCIWVPLLPTRLALPLVTQKILHRKFQKIRSEWLERFERKNRVII